MATLFEITTEFQALYDMATEDGDPAALADTLEAMMPELESKAAGYVSVINQLDMEAAKAEEIAKAFKAKADARKNSVKAMKNALLIALDRINATELAAGQFTIKAVKNGGKKPLKITGEVPQDMMRMILEPDTDRIREFLECGTELEYAHLEERGRHISIK